MERVGLLWILCVCVLAFQRMCVCHTGPAMRIASQPARGNMRHQHLGDGPHHCVFACLCLCSFLCMLSCELCKLYASDRAVQLNTARNTYSNTYKINGQTIAARAHAPGFILIINAFYMEIPLCVRLWLSLAWCICLFVGYNTGDN